MSVLGCLVTVLANGGRTNVGGGSVDVFVRRNWRLCVGARKHGPCADQARSYVGKMAERVMCVLNITTEYLRPVSNHEEI